MPSWENSRIIQSSEGFWNANFFLELRYWVYFRCFPPATCSRCLWDLHTSPGSSIQGSFAIFFPILKFSFYSFFFSDYFIFRVPWYHLYLNVLYPSPISSWERCYSGFIIVFIHLETVSFSSRFFFVHIGNIGSCEATSLPVGFSCHFVSSLNHLSFSKLAFLFQWKILPSFFVKLCIQMNINRIPPLLHSRGIAVELQTSSHICVHFAHIA